MLCSESIEHLGSRRDGCGSHAPRRTRELAPGLDPPVPARGRCHEPTQQVNAGRGADKAGKPVGKHVGRGFPVTFGSCVMYRTFPAGDSQEAGIRQWHPWVGLRVDCPRQGRGGSEPREQQVYSGSGIQESKECLVHAGEPGRGTCQLWTFVTTARRASCDL